jgi:polar amino acid transport system substrate-binding protein
LPQAQIVPYDDFAKMAQDVVRGKLYAALMDSARANTWRRSNPEYLIQVRTTIDKTRHDPLAIAVGWENTSLLAWINLYLETIRGDGTAERLYQKWFQSHAATDESSNRENGR